MKTIIDRASERGVTDKGWLRSYHTFSFADYYNPDRMQFGALKVLNDDTVEPLEGFGLHQHQNMEIITIPLAGTMRHSDSLENSEILVPGQIQLISAGTSVYHSEYNDSDIDPLEFLQIWVTPKKQNIMPDYKIHDITSLLDHNELSPFIQPASAVSIEQNAWFSWGNMDKGVSKKYKLYGHHTGVYIFVVEGSVEIKDEVLNRRDGMGIWHVKEFEIEALEDSQVLLIEVPI